MRSRRKVGGAGCAVGEAVVAAAWCGLFALLATGCGGGGGPLSMHDYTQRSRAVCTRAERRAGRVADTDPRDLPASARAVAKVVGIRRQALTDLRALHAPDRLVNAAPGWLALFDQALDELDAMGVELRRGNRARADAAWQKAVILTDRARELAPPLGLSACAFDVVAFAPVPI